MPLKPDPAWPQDRLDAFRKDHLKIVRSMVGSHPADIAKIESRWRRDDEERHAYSRFQYEMTSSPFRKHPRFTEWIAESEKDWSNGAKPIPPLFESWLKQKEAPEPPMVTQIVVTPLGVVTYKHPTNIYGAAIDAKLIEIATGNPSADLRTYEAALGIKILRIDARGRKDFGASIYG